MSSRKPSDNQTDIAGRLLSFVFNYAMIYLGICAQHPGVFVQ